MKKLYVWRFEALGDSESRWYYGMGVDETKPYLLLIHEVVGVFDLRRYDVPEDLTTATAKLQMVDDEPVLFIAGEAVDWTDDGGGEFNPDWTVRPGRTIEDLMEERGLSEIALAAKCDLPALTIKGLLVGDPMTDEVAAKLAAGTGTSASFWRNREALYRSDLARGRKDMS